MKKSIFIFFVQSVPSIPVSEISRTIKRITAKQLFERHRSIEEKLWGGNFWTSGFYANTVGQYGNEDMIRKYVETQGKRKEYKKLHNAQFALF